MNIASQKPIWLQNYAPGYIGFQFRSNDPLNAGIAYFEHWERLSEIKVAHCFIVSGPNSCIEALGEGVRENELQPRFLDPHLAVFFRKPALWTPYLGHAIVTTAAGQIGRPYDYRLIAGQALINTWLFHRCLSRNAELDTLAFFNSAAGLICSELAAFCLDSQPVLHDLGCLADPDYAITPQRLFEDDVLFEAWKSQASPSGSEEA